MEQLLSTVPDLLTKTLSPDKNIRKTAEDAILNLETTSPLYASVTLSLSQTPNLNHDIKTQAAIAFKNFIKRHWRFDPNDETRDQTIDRIDQQQREAIKRQITMMMLKSSSHIQRQLSEAISIIASCDFPEKWPWLIVELKDSLEDKQNSNFDTLSGVLQTAHSVFRRYRHELPSVKLWTEIKHVIDHFGQPFTNKFQQLIEVAKVSPPNSDQLIKIAESLLLCTKIYRSLITQDLPEYFEDTLNNWLTMLLWLLQSNMEFKDTQSIKEDTKSEICEIASLFVQRYSDADNAGDFIRLFAQQIWNLLINTNQDTKYDSLVSAAIRYLVSVASRPESRSLFESKEALDSLCKGVIIPNLIFRELDEELFEDDPEEYVRKDIEGSDVDTRRRAGCDLVQALSRFIESKLMDAFGPLLSDMLKSYESNKKANWKHKDLAIFLYSAMSIKGSTRQHGTVAISEFVNVEKFLDENISCELKSESQDIGCNVLKADALRYITNFRNHISLDLLVLHLPDVVRLVTSANVVVRTYAAITLERLLTMRDPKQPNTTAFKPDQFEPYLGELVKTLFDALDMPGSSENDHVMKAIMRLFSFSRSHSLVQFLPTVVPKMTEKLGIVAKNPSRPFFNHYLFETLALLIRAACEQQNQSIREQFEDVLFNIFGVIVAQDVQEFIPYVLQLLNLILQAHKTEMVSEKFKNFLQQILSPNLWERTANVKPLVDLLHTYIQKMPQEIVNQDKLLPILGIFQKLIASKATDHEGLELLQTMMIHIPTNQFDERIKDIFALLFQRLTGSKTVKLVKGVLVCFSLYAHLRSPKQLASSVNQLQAGIFGMVLEKLFIADAKKITNHLERRICICGMIKILGQLPLIDNGAYNHLWAPYLVALTEMLELSPEAAPEEDDHFADITENLDFQAHYSRLNYASIKRDDPTKEVGDLKRLLAVSLSNLSTKLPQFVLPKIQPLNQELVSCLMNYCQSANVMIS